MKAAARKDKIVKILALHSKRKLGRDLASGVHPWVFK
jgi:hypothetical protein